MNIFIDTNIFLSFYHLTSDDLEELSKLNTLLDSGQVVLYLPDQTVDEYWRNRETKIADAMNQLKNQKLNLQWPAFCKEYTEYEILRQLQSNFKKNHSFLVEKISKDIENQSLEADRVIMELFDKSKRVQTSQDLISKAQLRMAIGNPPGKNGSLGDAINWEALLESIVNNEILHFVTDDRDYFSSLHNDKPNEFLVREWTKKKDADVVFYRCLAFFFSEHYPDIDLASELEESLVVESFVKSASFQATHDAIKKLKMFENFSESQVSQIVNAALGNDQVNWILGDRDVFRFMTKMVEEYRDKIEESDYKRLVKNLEEVAVDKTKEEVFSF